ncbi:hypothetical protein ACKWTF_007472 [Chironomus riparius]
MVIWYKILIVVVTINLDYFVVTLPNIVIVNNKPMTYNRKEDFAEIITVVESDIPKKVEDIYKSDKRKNKQNNQLNTFNTQQKSNLFKTSGFITNSNFKGGLITKHNFTLHLPVNNNQIITSDRFDNSKFSSNFYNLQNKESTTTTTTETPFILQPEIVSAIIYSNDLISSANSLNKTPNGIIKHDYHNKISPAIENNQPHKENSVIIVHTTASPPIFVASATRVTKPTKTKRKKDNSSATLSTDSSNIHEHFIKNLDYYRKILNLNCSNNANVKNQTKQQLIISDSENETVEIKPKPTNKEDKDKDKDKDKEKDKKKCKCKKKHGHHHHDHHDHDHHHGHHDHHGHHHHHHKGSKESKESHEEHKPSYEHKPQTPIYVEQKPQEAHKVITGIPTTYSHLHQHQHRVQSSSSHTPSIISPINRVTAPINTISTIPNKIDYFEAPEKLPPLGDDYEEVGNMFDTFYRAIENAFSGNKEDDQESVDYESREYENEESGSDYSENESEDENYSEDYKKKRRKKRDLLERKNVLKSKASPRKSLITKITITNEYDDSIHNIEKFNQTSSALKLKTKKENIKRNITNNRSESSEEYDDDIIESIMSFRDDFDSYSDEYYEDLSLSSKHTNDTKKLNEMKTKKKSEISIKKKYQEDESPTNFITDRLQSIFSYVGNIFPSFPYFDFGIKDTTRTALRRKTRQRKKRNNYDGETYLKVTETIETTEKPESQFKRPKRENEKLPWYFPTFLYAHNDAGSTEQLSSSTKKWYLPWDDSSNEKYNNVEVEDITERHAIETTPKEGMDETTAKAMPYDFFGMISQLLATRKKESKSIISKRIRKKGYNNYQLWRLFPMSKDDVKYLNEFRMSTNGRKIHWLKNINIKDSTDVVVPPSYVNSFKDFLSEGEIKHSIKIRSIQHAIKFENPRLNKRDQIELELINGHPITWYRYHTFRDIQMYYDYLKRKYPSFVELIQIGWSFNGKPLTIVKVSSKPKQTLYDTKKPAIFILSGTSPHIWLPIACSTYILNSLVTNIANDDSFGRMIRKFDWYILSLLNPDGYDYSMTVDRLWQKSRSRQFLSTDETFISSALNWFRSSNVNQTEKVCYGVDMTKNFDSNWKEDESTEKSKCSDFYKGPHASSEPEIKLLSNFLLKHNKSIKLFMNLDGYGQQILFPSSKLNRSFMDELNDMARSGLRNVKMHRDGERKYGINTNYSGMSSGTVESFAMNKAKIKYTYRIESMDNTQYSIFVPATSIEQNANEILDIIKGMVKHLENE